MSKKSRLGAGVGALFSSEGLSDVLEPGAAATAAKERLKDLPVDLLQRGKYQPRTHMDEGALADLAESIKAQGIVQPIVVREIGDGRYEIIAGERRWRASQLAGLDKVPAVIRNIPDEAAIAVALIENIQRENLNPIEEAQALKRLADEFGLTHEEVSASVGRSRAGVTNLLRLLSLPDQVRQMLEQGVLDMGHGRALLGLEGGDLLKAAREAADKGLSVRETEQLVRRFAAGEMPGSKRTKAATSSADIRALEQDLSEKLGAKVQISHNAKGAGKLSISYTSSDELEGILERIR